ncbi:MAG: lysostaphin resistance A-like protein [Thermaurantiacus sp.]
MRGFDRLLLLSLLGYGLLALHLVVAGGFSLLERRLGGFLFVNTVAVLAALLPLAGLLWRRGNLDRVAMAWLWRAAALFVVSSLLHVASFSFGLGLEWGQWNWVGKLAVVLFLGLALLLLPAEMRKRTGIVTWVKPGAGRPVWIAVGIFALLGVVQALATDMAHDNLVETLAFQLTMPSLSEEWLFRGLLMALLFAAMPATWTIAGARLGPAWLASGLLFGAIHGLLYSPSEGILFEPLPILATGLAGLGFGWIAARAGSVWPAVIAHSLVNGFAPALALIGIG